ncbi:AsnC family transcriptional regulator [Yinghuangia aomiensis]
MAQDSVDSSAGTGRAAAAAEPLDELDLALVHALQVAPRAPWSGLAPVLGVDAVTLARRWRRLSASGRAWVTCYAGPGRGTGRPGLPGPGRTGGRTRCLGRGTRHPHAPTRRPSASNTCRTAGTCSSPSAPPTRRRCRPTCSTACPMCRASSRSGPTWSPGSTRRARRGASRALDAGQQRTLGAAADESPRDRRVTAVDRALVLALGRDGRTPVNALARTVGVSPATAARRVAWLIGSGHGRLRCEVAHTFSGWPVTALWWLRVPPPDLDEVGRRLAAHPDVRMSAAVTGSANLFAAMWLRSLADLPAFEADLIRRYPRVEVLDRTVVLDSGQTHRPDPRGGWAMRGLCADEAVEPTPV